MNFQSSKEQEGERLMSQIGREIHDNIIQSLYDLRRQFDRVEKHLVAKDEQFYMLKSIAEQIAKDATSISQSLNTNYIKTTDLEILINNELDRLCGPKKIAAQIIVEGNLEHLESEKNY